MPALSFAKRHPAYTTEATRQALMAASRRHIAAREELKAARFAWLQDQTAETTARLREALREVEVLRG
jgi:hypothetical protein